jgi:TolA-binding protein
LVGALVLAVAAPRLGAQEAVAEPAELVRLAEGLLSRQFYELARQELEPFLARHPDHELAPRATLMLAECLRLEGQIAPTVEVLSTFGRRWPAHERAPAVALLLGELLLGQGELERAEAVLTPLQESADETVREGALYGLSQLRIRRNEAAGARELLARLAAAPLQPDRPFRAYGRFALAALLQAGDAAAAARLYEELSAAGGAVPPALREESLFRLGEVAQNAGDPVTAALRWGQQVAEYPDGAWSREGRRRHAWALFLAGQCVVADERAADWLERYPGDPAAPDLKYLRGAALAEQNRHAEALPFFQSFSDGGEGLPAEYVRLAACQAVRCLLGMGRYGAAGEAAAAFTARYPDAPERFDVLYFAAEALVRQGAREQAEAPLRQVLDAAPPGWPHLEAAAVRLRQILQGAGRPREAASLYRTLAGRGGVANRAGLLLQAAEIEAAAGDAAAAEADFLRLRQEFPGTAEARGATLRLAESLARRGEVAGAEALVGELRQALAPGEQGRGDLFAGYLLYVQGRHAEAEPLFRRLLVPPAADPRLAAEARYYLGAVLLELGRTADGLGLFEELLQMAPDARPRLPDALQLRLVGLFRQAGRLDAAARLCGELAGSADPLTAARAALDGVHVERARGQGVAARRLVEALLERLAGAESGPLDALRREALATAGEIYLEAQEADRAVTAFQRSLDRSGARGPHVAQARWGLAQVLFAEQRLNLALQAAVSGFVLCDDAVYTPRTMLLAVRILAAQGKWKEARVTWEELRTRYPAAAEASRGVAEVQELLRQTAAADG